MLEAIAHCSRECPFVIGQHASADIATRRVQIVIFQLPIAIDDGPGLITDLLEQSVHLRFDSSHFVQTLLVNLI